MFFLSGFELRDHFIECDPIKEIRLFRNDAFADRLSIRTAVTYGTLYPCLTSNWIEFDLITRAQSQTDKLKQEWVVSDRGVGVWLSRFSTKQHYPERWKRRKGFLRSRFVLRCMVVGSILPPCTYRVTFTIATSKRSFVCEAPDETVAIRASRKALGLMMRPFPPNEF